MKDYIKYIPLSLLIVYCVKLITTTVTLNDSPILAILAALTGFMFIVQEEKKLLSVNDKIKELKEDIEKQKELSQEIRTHLSSIKLKQQVKTVSRF